MNKFDQAFFSKYVSGETQILEIAHKHFITIIGTISLNYFFWVLIPTFLYYNFLFLQQYIPFFVLEIFIICIFLKNIYDIFNWYNDAWIITTDGVVELDWELFSANATSVKFSSIEWLELVQWGFVDTIFWKWDIVIHKIWWENNFRLKDGAKVYEVVELIDDLQKKVKKKHKKSDSSQNVGNYDMVIKALWEVVEWYLWKHWYPKDDSEETLRIINKAKSSKWTIDLSS